MARSEVYNIDCMEGMARYPDKYFDLAVCDPPYGIGEDGHKSIQRGRDGYRKVYKPFVGGGQKTS